MAALVTRTELKPVALATATADARDLPEEKRLVSCAALFLMPCLRICCGRLHAGCRVKTGNPSAARLGVGTFLRSCAVRGVCVPLCAILQIRRELAAAMRDVGKLVGNAAMLSYVVNIVTTNHQAMNNHIREAGVCRLSSAAEAGCCNACVGLAGAP